jgi:hypothetical protein
MQLRLEMKALAYLGPGRKSLEDRPRPGLAAPTDAIVRMVKTTICGSDLHILKGDVPNCDPGRILGHEGIGVVEMIGPSATAFKPRDRVLISCIGICGKCAYCRRLMYSHCTFGGWILGNEIDGPKRNGFASPTPTAASIAYPKARTKTPWSCSATSCPPLSRAAWSTQGPAGQHRRDRRGGSNRTRGVAHLPVLLVGASHRDRSRRRVGDVNVSKSTLRTSTLTWTAPTCEPTAWPSEVINGRLERFEIENNVHRCASRAGWTDGMG